jgi:hypothetical protein
VQNERYRMMHSPVTTDQKWMNRNLVIFPPFSTPQGGERGANQNVPLTANSSQVPVECVGILGGAGPYTVSGIQSAENSKKKLFVGSRTKVWGTLIPRALGGCQTASTGSERKRRQIENHTVREWTKYGKITKKITQKKKTKKKLTLFMEKKLISRTGIY